VDLLEFVKRAGVPDAWEGDGKIPWHEAGFSRRMLAEHLSQEHDAASRRFAVIEKHVEWIHADVLSGRQTKILDLGCGPGLYTNRLAKLGHECVGIDYSPASVAYAVEQARGERLRCSYRCEDIRTGEYGTGLGLVMLIHGEFNTFRPADARAILEKANAGLAGDGVILLEPHTFEAVRQSGQQPPSWYSAPSGLFSERPHVCLEEHFWDAASRTSTTRFFIVDAATAEVTQHGESLQAYSDDEYRSALRECGFEDIRFSASLTGVEDESQEGLFAITARTARGSGRVVGH
jgi:SAM-dependent methyltransferase